MTIGVFLPFGLSDLVAATPMLRALRRHVGPEARLVGISQPRLAGALAGTEWLDEQWFFDPRPQRQEPRDWALVRRMHVERVETVLLLCRSFRAAVLAWLGGAKERIGYARHSRAHLLTRKLDYPNRRGRPGNRSMVDDYLKMAEAIGCPAEPANLELATTGAEELSADAVWANLGLRCDGRVLVVNPGASVGSAKLWPVKHFGQLARRVADELDHDVLVLCGPKDRQVAQEVVVNAAHPRVFSMADQALDLGTAKACVKRCRMLVSGDSGMRFVAAAFGKPVVTLFGPTQPNWKGGSVKGAIDLSLDLGCTGCQNRICPLRHHQCMVDLAVDVVYRQVARLLETSLAACAA